MTCGEIWDITRNIIKPEDLADKLLQTYWKANGHEGDIKDLDAYPKAKERLMHHLNLFVERTAHAPPEPVCGQTAGRCSAGSGQGTRIRKTLHRQIPICTIRR